METGFRFRGETFFRRLDGRQIKPRAHHWLNGSRRRLDGWAIDGRGEAIVGGRIVGETIVGEAIVGDTITGEAIVGEAIVGETIAGEAIVGEAIDGESIDGESIVSGANDGESIGGVRSGSDELRRCSPR
jgi:hypothetical protein